QAHGFARGDGEIVSISAGGPIFHVANGSRGLGPAEPMVTAGAIDTIRLLSNGWRESRRCASDAK
ncbi:MAG TPA: hypothetical protein VNZ24_03670, partial [Vicinamibacterales bacterium]|nr:hypothetical protein [Vicinamibacterales bacterium]